MLCRLRLRWRRDEILFAATRRHAAIARYDALARRSLISRHAYIPPSRHYSLCHTFSRIY